MKTYIMELSQEEYEMLRAVREEQLRKERITECKTAIQREISNSIDKIGFEETKRLVRELNLKMRYGA